MHSTVSSHSLVTSRHSHQIQKFKMRAILCAFSVAAICLLVLSLSSAVPIDTTTTLPLDDTTTIEPTGVPAVGFVNGSKLVITNVVKTLEFEVALVEDDNSTETSFASTGFIETELKIINPALLEAVAAARAATTKAPTPTNDSSSSSSSSSESDEDN